MQTHVLKVDEGNDHLRLDIFLTKILPETSSRSFIKRLIESDGVTVNGKKVKVHQKLLVNDEVCVFLPEEEVVDERIDPENIPLDILYEDETLLVVNKPSGMLVHPARGCYSGTLVNALLYHCQELSDFNTTVRPGIVHRLDQETSGLLVVAKNNTAHMNLSRQFEKHRVRKRYVALVEGLIEFDEGLIDAGLGKHPRYFDKKAVVFDDSAKKAKTFYKVLKRFQNVTYVALFPKTGRTHQLRVHMAYLGHPILGDEKYGKKNIFPRLALHAQSLGFFHPRTTKYIEFSVISPSEIRSFH